MNWQNYLKAYIPVVVGVIVYGLSYVHVTGQMTVTQALTWLVTAGVVYLVPNKNA